MRFLYPSNRRLWSMAGVSFNRIMGICIILSGAGTLILGAVYPEIIRDIYWTSTNLGPMVTALGVFLFIIGILTYLNDGSKEGSGDDMLNIISLGEQNTGSSYEGNQDDQNLNGET